VSGTELVTSLQTALGDDSVLAGSDAKGYETDGTFLTQTPLAVAFPASTQQVSQVLNLCYQSATPVIARGGGTSLAGGPVPLGGGVVLSLERLTNIQIHREDTCAVVGAGTITSQLQQAAASCGLFYPPDPGSVHISTIGGNIACNAGGMRCLKYGVTSDYVLGLSVVLADGRILTLGGSTRKRASGYRLAQLFVGSEGTLGVVCEATLRLDPLPRHAATAMVGYLTVEDAAQAVSQLMASGYLPSAIELLDRRTVELVSDRMPQDFRATLEAVLIVEADGNDSQQVSGELQEMVERLGGVDVKVARTRSDSESLWDARRQIGRRITQRPHSSLSEDIAVPLSKVATMIGYIHEVSQQLGVEVIVFGHIGDGNLHPVFEFDDPQRAAVSTAVAKIFRKALALGGTVSAEHGLGALKRDFALAEHGDDALGLMRAIKDSFDPSGVLNPHKVFPEGPPEDSFLSRQPGWASETEPR
jgi:glycolate oxidase